MFEDPLEKLINQCITPTTMYPNIEVYN